MELYELMWGIVGAVVLINILVDIVGLLTITGSDVPPDKDTVAARIHSIIGWSFLALSLLFIYLSKYHNSLLST